MYYRFNATGQLGKEHVTTKHSVVLLVLLRKVAPTMDVILCRTYIFVDLAVLLRKVAPTMDVILFRASIFVVFARPPHY